ncbi:MAG: tetratricopeptide repeat protein [Acidimicrobiales bacterium]
MSSPTNLDPDALAALEEERDFLLGSLDDLEAEHAAGDIDDADFSGLKDDYTRRAAEVIRAIDQQRGVPDSRPPNRWRQGLVWLVGLAILGGISGVLIARTSGARTDSETLTGGVRQSEVTRLNQAQSLFPDPDSWGEAIEIYDDVLEDSPSNVEALTYRAWLSYRQGSDTESAIAAFTEVARVDEAYPDAIVFHTIVLADDQRYREAGDVLRTLDLGAAPEEIVAIVSQRDVAGEVFGELAYPALINSAEPTLDELDLSVEEAMLAAAYLFTSDKPERSVAVIKLYRAVQTEDPTNATALSREAWLLFQTFDPELMVRARRLVDAAIDADPDNAEARFTRASMLVSSDVELACLDLAVVLDDPRREAGLAEQAESLATAFCG